MIKKTLKRTCLTDVSNTNEDLKYWLKRPAKDRVAAVEILETKSMEAQQDFKELLALFNARHVKYVIVGGYALAFHGAPRMTGDIDIFVEPSNENALKVLEALKEFGFGNIGLKIEDFSKKNNVIQLGQPPVRIDIITSLTGVSWNKAYATKKKGKYGDLYVSFISRELLLKNKRSVGRKKDQADLEALGAK